MQGEVADNNNNVTLFSPQLYYQHGILLSLRVRFRFRFTEVRVMVRFLGKVSKARM